MQNNKHENFIYNIKGYKKRSRYKTHFVVSDFAEKIKCMMTIIVMC